MGIKRLFDIGLAAFFLLLLLPVFLAVSVVVRCTSFGPVFFSTTRVGRQNRQFQMYKFRTMRCDTPQVPTHLMVQPEIYLTPVGGFLRKTSLDELPQLINVIRGEMSLVGPRPALFNQDDLIAQRTLLGVDALLPGITGWAQVNGRDELSLTTKVAHDAFYLKNRSFLLDLKILYCTAIRVFWRHGVAH